MAFDCYLDSLAEGAGGIPIDLRRDVVDAEACVATGKTNSNKSTFAC